MTVVSALHLLTTIISGLLVSMTLSVCMLKFRKVLCCHFPVLILLDGCTNFRSSEALDFHTIPSGLSMPHGHVVFFILLVLASHTHHKSFVFFALYI